MEAHQNSNGSPHTRKANGRGFSAPLVSRCSEPFGFAWSSLTFTWMEHLGGARSQVNSFLNPSGGLIIRRSGVRVPTPVLPELARQVPTIQAIYGKPIKAGHPVPIRPFPALPEVRALPWRYSRLRSSARPRG